MNLRRSVTVSENRATPPLPRASGAARLYRLLFTFLRSHPRLLHWVLPALVLILTVTYELVAARWIHMRIGYPYHVVAEILFFAILGPMLAFSFARSFERWLDERDTSDWQATLLSRARTEVYHARKLNDDALQALFAAGVIIKTLHSASPDPSPELEAAIEAMEKALREVSGRLREHLMASESEGMQ